MDKKGQGVRRPELISIFVKRIFMFGLMIFGILQGMILFSPEFGKIVNDIIIKYFGGSSSIFLFVAAGFIGTGINELLERYFADVPRVFDKRVFMFFIMGAVVLGISFGVSMISPDFAAKSVIVP